MNREFCTKLRNREPLVGSFAKIKDPVVVEIMCQAALDFIVIDAEHSQLDRGDVSTLILAAKACGTPSIVRVPEGAKTWISTALDSGAAGIMVPHVSTVDEAEKLATLMGFGKGGRGFSPSTRAAEFGKRGVAKHLEMQAGETVLICQIEDREGAANASEIASLRGVDCLFVGPVDLAVSIGNPGPDSGKLEALCEAIVKDTVNKGKTAGIYTSSKKGAQEWQQKGASFNVVGTDQAFLQSGLRAFLE